MDNTAGKLLEILIPTLNRDEPLIRNINNIMSIIEKNDLYSYVGIIISDNGSDIESFERLKDYLNKHCSIDYQLYRQETNIGIEKNSLFLIEKASAKYVMTLGDDDYFTEKFLIDSLNYLKSGDYSGIIPNYIPVDIDGKQIAPLRDEIAADKIYDQDSLWICDRGHQLSCLIFLREGLIESYKKNVRPNVYPFLYFLAYSLTQGKMVHITREPFSCTLIQKKNWNYEKDNLMGELMCVIDCLPYNSDADKNKQIRIMVQRNIGRYCNKNTYIHPIRMIKRINTYDVSDKTKRLLKEQYIKQIITWPYRKMKQTSKK